jgi:hypothetical protein
LNNTRTKLVSNEIDALLCPFTIPAFVLSWPSGHDEGFVHPLLRDVPAIRAARQQLGLQAPTGPRSTSMR